MRVGVVNRVRDHAENLAIARIVIVALVLFSPETRAFPEALGIPPGLRTAPHGLGPFLAHVPMDAATAKVAADVALGAGAFALVGLFTRPALLLLLVAATYRFALAQFGGTVHHDMHLLWFVAVLAASPSGDALSLDALFESDEAVRARRTRAHVDYGLPLAVIRLLLGVVYFFPGFWKLAESGVAWFWSDNLLHQMDWKAFETDRVPAFRFGHVPWLVRIAGAGVVLFELSFGLLATFRRTRPVALVAGLAFHAATHVLMGIPFVSLWGSYVVLVDVRSLVRRLHGTRDESGERTPPADVPMRPSAWIVATAVALLVPATVQGFRGDTFAWPFGCYPTFQWIAGERVPDVDVTVVSSDGVESAPIRGRRGRPNAEWSMAWRAAGAYGGVVTDEALRSYATWLATKNGVAIPPGSRVRVHRIAWTLAPESWDLPPAERTLIRELTMP
ncbi:MAG: HTTM domain-containing protein [Polyangiaceae bacterium]